MRQFTGMSGNIRTNRDGLAQSGKAYAAQDRVSAVARRWPRITATFHASAESISSWMPVGGPLALVLCAMVLWSASLSTINPRNITDYGLISALPLSFFVALSLLTVSFCVVVHQRQVPAPVLFLHVVALIVIIHGTLALVYQAPRYSWTYKHIGVTSYIQRHGSIDPSLDDPYHHWAGFFALSALFNEIAGFDSALSYAIWAQVFFNLLYLGALLLIFKSCTSDQRLIWLGVWFFYLTNWIGQDYFAPQAMSYFFHLVILGVCLTWFKVLASPSEHPVRRWPVLAPLAAWIHKIVSHAAPSGAPDKVSRPIQRIGVMMIVILSFFIIVSSHQLTPYMTIASVLVLVAFRRSSTRTLPVLMGVLLMTWITYMATAYLSRHNIWYDSFGLLSSNVENSLTDVSRSSPGHTFTVFTTRALTALVWGLALLGGIRRLRKGYWDLSIALLAFAPFPISALQSYGGEILFRIYLFSLPGMAFFAAALLYPSPDSSRSWRTTAVTVLVSCALLAGFSFAYYGQERMNRFTKNELDAAQYLYQIAPPGSLVLQATFNFPSRFRVNYDQYQYPTLTELDLINKHNGTFNIDHIVNYMDRHKYPAAYLVLSRSQKEHAELMSLLPVGTLEKLEEAAIQSEHFQLIFANADARIFTLADDANGAGK